jgi:hypothetical protein
VSNVIPTPEYTHYKKASMTRLPVRLGEDVFKTGKISKETGDRLVDSMRAFAAIMKVNGVEAHRACATSAMREAKNAARWIRKVRRATGIHIDVIDGEEEARLIFHAKLFDKIQPEEENLLFIDVGGGSTELTFFSRRGAPRITLFSHRDRSFPECRGQPARVGHHGGMGQGTHGKTAWFGGFSGVRGQYQQSAQAFRSSYKRAPFQTVFGSFEQTD